MERRNKCKRSQISEPSIEPKKQKTKLVIDSGVEDNNGSYQSNADKSESDSASTSRSSLDESQSEGSIENEIHNETNISEILHHTALNLHAALLKVSFGRNEIDGKIQSELKLRPHQIDAVDWMLKKEKHFPHGGIPADDMGMGKTITIAALISTTHPRYSKYNDRYKMTSQKASPLEKSNSTIIVCPTSCIDNWRQELLRVNRRFRIYIYHGPNKDNTTTGNLPDLYDIVLTTYGTISRDPEGNYNEKFGDTFWMRLVLDEGHDIRNPKTRNAKVLSKLPARYKWIVSGTPFHNYGSELFSYCKFLGIFPFNERETWKQYIGMGGIDKLVPGGLDRMKFVSASLILRRVKSDLEDGDIPEKRIKRVYVRLSEEERHLYDELKEHWMKMKNLSKTQRVAKFDEYVATTRLRQCTIAPCLMTARLNEHSNNNSVDALLNRTDPIYDVMYGSSKIKSMMRHLKRIRQTAREEGRPMDKVIITSSWTAALGVIDEHLNKEGFTTCTISGDVPISKRQNIIDKFNRSLRSAQIMLLSMKAGAVGLNITGANWMFIVEPNWNPQVQSQVQDRIHRIGQEKKVTILNFITRDTVEENVLKEQQKKLKLSNTLLYATEFPWDDLDEYDIGKLFEI